ncbi:MAG: MFS transporter [Pseudomonadota bacterium]
MSEEAAQPYGVAIVTSQLGEQNLNDGLIAVTAFSQGKIQGYQIRTIEAYTTLFLNVGFSYGVGYIEQSISTRDTSGLGGAVAPISIFVDDFNMIAAGFGSAIDANLILSKREQIGLFFCLLTLTQKLGMAAATGMSFYIVEMLGFDPATAKETGEVVFAVAATISIMPAAFYVLIFLLLRKFPIDAQMQKELRR